MALNPVLLAVLACPRDKQPLYYFESEGWLYNPRLQLRYSVEDDIPVLLPDAGTAIDDAEHHQLMATIAERQIPPTGEAT